MLETINIVHSVNDCAAKSKINVFPLFKRKNAVLKSPFLLLQVQLREQQQMKGAAVLQRLKLIRDLDEALQIEAAQDKSKDERLR